MKHEKKMTATGRRPCATRVDLLMAVLSDGAWHSTKELARRVGHTFGGAKFTLSRTGIHVDRRPIRTRRWQWQYRIDLANPLKHENGEDVQLPLPLRARH